ncbi:hypothetical protein, partial [Cytobacillus oceanisediminis]|uniref:hypothetical protein n=1 Tax=Cytobacillus oceanisediminis TaxID=665099 RepID=UPI0037C0F329
MEGVDGKIFGKEKGFYVEVVEDKYQYGDMMGFGVVNEKGEYYLGVERGLECEELKKWGEDEWRKKRVY